MLSLPLPLKSATDIPIEYSYSVNAIYVKEEALFAADGLSFLYNFQFVV